MSGELLKLWRILNCYILLDGKRYFCKSWWSLRFNHTPSPSFFPSHHKSSFQFELWAHHQSSIHSFRYPPSQLLNFINKTKKNSLNFLKEAVNFLRAPLIFTVIWIWWSKEIFLCVVKNRTSTVYWSASKECAGWGRLVLIVIIGSWWKINWSFNKFSMND